MSIGSTVPTMEELPVRSGIPSAEKSETGQGFQQALEAKLAVRETSQGSSGTTTVEYTVKPGDTLWKLGVKQFGVDPYQIARDNGIANPDRIYPGQKLVIRRQAAPEVQEVVASWYGKEYHRKPTASGEPFDMFQNTLAHKTLPLGTRVRLTDPESGRTVVGRINDRGPFIPGRDIDLSYGLAGKLGMVSRGVGKLIMEVL